jgi:hypothetical protein
MMSPATRKPGVLDLSARQMAWGGALALLCAPAVAMLFTREMNWGAEDFAAFAVMIGVAGLALELAFRVGRSAPARVAMAAFVVLGFLFVWAELAVGILPS